jgi:hypothetical protein
MNEANRTAIVIAAAAWIVLMAIVIFLTWAAPGDVIEALGDLVQDMDKNNDTAGRLIVTLGALALAVLGLLIIILELAPEDEERELRVRQAGSTTIVPARALKTRLEEALTSLPDVNTARARVYTKDNAIATNLDLGLEPRSSVGHVTQEASRVVVDIIQTELGLPVAGLPNVRISFGDGKPLPVTKAAESEPVAASSVVQQPSPSHETPLQETNSTPEGASATAPAATETREHSSEPSTEPPATGETQAPDERSLRSRLYGDEQGGGESSEPPRDQRP